MNLIKGWNRQTMMSLFLKEATFDAGVTMNAGNACSMIGYNMDATWPDVVAHDKGDITGYEHGTQQEILTQGVKFNYKEEKCKPNTLAGIGNLVLGSRTSTKDGAFAAYKHYLCPVTYGTALPSMQVEDKFGGVQYAYKGVKGASMKLSGKAGGYLGLEAELLGSGTRASSATAFVASITESWLKLANAKVWLETGADISITAHASFAQDAENISSGTPDVLSARLVDFEFMFDNDLELQYGFGGGGVAVDIDYKRRKAGLKFTLLFNTAAELAYYTAQNPCAFELNMKGALIAAGGAMYYGAILVVPKFYLKEPPLPKGGINDTVTAEFVAEIVDQGTEPVCELVVYNVPAAYLA